MQQQGGFDVIWTQVRGCQGHWKRQNKASRSLLGPGIYHVVSYISEACVELQQVFDALSSWNNLEIPAAGLMLK